MDNLVWQNGEVKVYSVGGGKFYSILKGNSGVLTLTKERILKDRDYPEGLVKLIPSEVIKQMMVDLIG